MINYKYCPYCKGKLKSSLNFYNCLSCKRNIYKHSSVTASFYPIEGNKVLLARRGVMPKKGYYDSIGGFLNYGEHPKKGVLREVQEETGTKVKITRLLGIFIDRYTYNRVSVKTLNIFYLGTIIGGNPTPQDDIDKLKWFPINSLPKKIAFDCIKKSLRELKKCYNSSLRGVV